MPSRPELLERRLSDFGLGVRLLARGIPRDAAGVKLASQLVRAAIAPAGLYGEARESESTADYIHKAKLCLKELRETAVWLRMARGVMPAGRRSEDLSNECNELTAILVTCVRKARGNGG